MMKRYFSLLLFSFSITIPQVISYAKVTKNGKQAEEFQGEPVGIFRSEGPKSEGRSVQDIVITASPMFVNARNPHILKPGEAIDYPTTKGYSTLDEEIISNLDSIAVRQKVQERFHPPAPFEHVIAHGNAIKQQSRPSGSSGPSNLNPRPPMGPDITYTKPMMSDSYDYPPSDFESDEAKPFLSSDEYSSASDLKAPASYGEDSYLNGHLANHEPHKHYGSKPMYGDVPPKGAEYETHFDPPSFSSSGYVSDHDYHHDIIYDHIPDDHHLHYHDHTHITTEEPEMNDQRLDKRPYSYYYIGRKLWYIPLYFSIYFIIYIAALVLRSVARHKINFPANLAAAAGARSVGQQKQSTWWDYTTWILQAIDKYQKT